MHLNSVKKFTVFVFVALFLAACGGEDSAASGAKGAGAPGKGGPSGKGGPGGRPAREIAVEGYIAEAHEGGKTFSAMATLEPLNSVELTAATSGRLMNLYAKDGAQVQKGTLLAKIDDSELRAQLKQAESNKQLAQQKYDRAKGLYEKDGATKVDMEAAEASLKSAEASVELIRAQIAKTEVRAPFAGKLGFVNVSVGAWLMTGTSVATLSEVRKLKAKFALPQRYASALKPGDAVELKDEERNISASGKVKALEAGLSESSRTRQVLVEVNNAGGELLAGSYAKVNVTMQAGVAKSIPIPAEAFTLDKDGAYVFVATGGKAKIKHVQTGLRTPITVDVTGGLDEGDTVITSGLISLREGISVRIREIRHNADYEVE
ncbi:membrane fusion protein, multidrug efflux system [Fibrobacter sp. UWCM]|nr:membrane fusion protein, multidrug efflux system [Fibrobacter sp. UWCM]